MYKKYSNWWRWFKGNRIFKKEIDYLKNQLELGDKMIELLKMIVRKNEDNDFKTFGESLI